MNPSPSARRAWVEIYSVSNRRIMMSTSPSARRAWVEIIASRTVSESTETVALRKEGVG